MRLIDADKVLESIVKQNELIKTIASTNEELILISNMICQGFKQEIDNAPTIDAVEVVRCKDCEYWKCNDCKNDDHGYCPIDENDYCSRGERK